MKEKGFHMFLFGFGKRCQTLAAFFAD